MSRPPLLFLAAVTLAAPFSQAQQPATGVTEAATRQVESFNRRDRLLRSAERAPVVSNETAPALYPGELDDVGPQWILLAQQATRRTWWEAAVDVQYFYTSNMFLTEKANTDTGVLVSTIYAGFAPTWKVGENEFAMRAGYRHQRWNYGLDDTSNQLNNFDFDVGTVYLGARYTFNTYWTAAIGLDWNRLLGAEDNYNEFYTELVASWGLERAIPLGEKAALSLAYIGSQHFTQTDEPDDHINDRLDNIFQVSLVYQITPELFVQPYYRLQHAHYWENSDRNDLYNNLGVTLVYKINDWASVRAFTNWEHRESNDPAVTDYQKFDTGGGLSIAVRF